MVSTNDFKINDNCTLHTDGNVSDIRELKKKLCQFSAPPLVVDEFKIMGKEELPMTERQIEIKEKIDGCEKAIDKLEEEYAQETINAQAEREAYVRYANYSALIKAGFSEEQAFEMLNN